MKTPALLSLFLLSAALPHAQAQTARTWVGGSGTEKDWNLASNWKDGVLPTSPSNYADFAAGTNAEISINAVTGTERLTLAGNTSIALLIANLSPATTFTIDSLVRVGNGAGGATHLSFGGAGSVIFSSFHVGSNSASTGGNTLTFTNGVRAARFAASDSITSVGRFGTNNLLEINSAAVVDLGIVTVGNSLGVGNNGLRVSGAGSELTISGTGGSRGLRIGVSNAGASYETGMSNNWMEISDGGRVVVSSTTGSSNLLYIGAQTLAHNNGITITGEDSALELGKGGATNGTGTAVVIGGTNSSSGAFNAGGNFILVQNGGAMRSVSGHTAAVTINNYDSTGQNDGANRLVIGAGGTVDLGGAINATRGLVQLDATGVLQAASLGLTAGSRFEAAGAGFKTTGVATLTNSVLAVSGSGATVAQALTLSSAVVLGSGSVLELGLFEDGVGGNVVFDTGGSLSIDTSATFRLVLNDGFAPDAGDEWTIFSGLVGGISGNFDFDTAIVPTLASGLSWDFSGFNDAGGWKVAVVPEPSTYAVGLLGLGVLAAALRQRRKA